MDCFSRQLFPKSRCLFMYRDIVKVAKSLYRLSYAVPSLSLAITLGRLSGWFIQAIVDSMGFCSRDFDFERTQNGLSFGVMVSSVVMRSYLDQRRRGLEVGGIRYEDLVDDPTETCRRIMEYCGLPVELAVSAVRGMEMDSQLNTPVSRDEIGRHPEPKLTADSKLNVNHLLKKYGMPSTDEQCLLEGTFTYKQN